MTDRVPTQILENGAIRYAEYDAAGNFVQYRYLLPADEPTEDGTPLNTENLLKDTTAALYDLSADATPDDVFNSIRNNAYCKIGETVTSARTDYGSKYLLCNGASISKAAYPTLGSMLPIDIIRSLAVGASVQTKKIKHVNGYYVVLKQSGTTCYVYYTNDPTGTWSVSTFTSSSTGVITDIAFGNGYYVITEYHGSYLYTWSATSLAGTWTSKNINNYGYASQIEFGNGYFVVRCGSSLSAYMYATDPTGTWTNFYPTTDSYYYLGGFAFLNGKFVISVWNNTYSRTYSATTPNITWTMEGGYLTENISGISYANGYYFAYFPTSAVTKYSTTLADLYYSSPTSTGQALYYVVYMNGYYYGWNFSSTKLYRSTTPNGTWSAISGTFSATNCYDGLPVYETRVMGIYDAASSYIVYYFDSEAVQLPTLSANNAYVYIKALE